MYNKWSRHTGRFLLLQLRCEDFSSRRSPDSLSKTQAADPLYICWEMGKWWPFPGNGYLLWKGVKPGNTGDSPNTTTSTPPIAYMLLGRPVDMARSCSGDWKPGLPARTVRVPCVQVTLKPLRATWRVNRPRNRYFTVWIHVQSQSRDYWNTEWSRFVGSTLIRTTCTTSKYKYRVRDEFFCTFI